VINRDRVHGGCEPAFALQVQWRRGFGRSNRGHAVTCPVLAGMLIREGDYCCVDVANDARSCV